MKRTSVRKNVILFFTLIAVLALFTACSKSEPAAVDNGGNNVTQEAQAAKPTDTATEPSKAAETTPEPTATPTPEPTATPTPEPTATPTPEPEPEPEPDDDDHEVDALGNTDDVYSIDKSRMVANLIDAADYGPYYVVTLNFKAQYEVRYENLADKKVGDTLILDDKSTTITHILAADDDYNFTVEKDAYEDGCRIVVQPDFADEFFTPEELEDLNYSENPENASFAFVCREGDNWFRAYTDWEWFDCYVPMYETVLWHVNLVVTENTEVSPAYYSYEDYPDSFTISGFDYLQLRDDPALQEEKGIRVYDEVDLQITEVLDDTGRSTGEISRIDEIYMP